MQKTKESLPDEFMSKIRAANAAMSRWTDAELNPVKELINWLTAWPQVVAMDSSDSSDDSGKEGSDETVPGVEERGEIALFEEGDQSEIRQERRKLEALQREYNEAVEGALQRRPKQSKRALGEDEPRPEDETMEEEIESLDPATVAELYRGRLKAQQDRVSRLEGLARKEVIPVAVGSTVRSNEAQSSKGGEEEQVQRPTRARISRWQSEEEPRSAKETTEEAIPEKVLEQEIEKARRQVQVNMEIMLQERMQLQQEQELEEVSKLSVVRRQAAEIEARRTGPQ